MLAGLRGVQAQIRRISRGLITSNTRYSFALGIGGRQKSWDAIHDRSHENRRIKA